MNKGRRLHLSYERMALLVSGAPAYPVSASPPPLEPKFIDRLQNVSYSFNYNAQQLRELGSFEYIKHRNSVNSRIPIVAQPQVDLSFGYFMFDGQNEKNIGFNIPEYIWDTTSRSWTPPSQLNGILTNSNLYHLPDFQNAPDQKADKGDVNFFVLAEDTTQRKQILGRETNENPEFTGLDLISFGNCYINNYSISAAVGQLVECSLNYTCSNITFDIYTPPPTGPQIGIPTRSPAVDGSGERASQLVNMPDLKDDYKFMNDSDFAMVLRPGDLEVKLINNKSGSDGGFNLLDFDEDLIAVQSIGIEIGVERKDLNGFGSNYIKDRKIQFPILCSLSIEVIAQNLGKDGTDISRIFKDDVDYDLQLTMRVRDSLRAFSNKEKESRKRIQMIVSNAKLNSENHSVQIGGYYNISADFVFEITPEGGFSIAKFNNP